LQGYLILLLIFAIVVAVFAVQNTAAVAISFLFWEANTSLVLVILVSVAVGAVMLYLVNFTRQLSMNKEHKELQRQIAALSKDKEMLQSSLSAYQKADSADAGAMPEAAGGPRGGDALGRPDPDPDRDGANGPE